MSYKAKVPSWAPATIDGDEHDPPSEGALAYFRNTVLGVATCPICGEVGLQYLKNLAVSKDADAPRLAYSLPMNLRGELTVLVDKYVQYGMCGECGYLASFSELAVKGRYASAKERGEVD